MKIHIMQNKKPDLPICTMKCDKPLADHLDKYEITKLMNCHSVNLIVGKPGSGKTSFLWGLFKQGGKKKIFRKVFTNIYLFAPTQSRASMKDNIFDVLPDDKKYDELTEANLSDVISRIKASEPDENTAIIFDDMGAYLKDHSTRKLFKELIYNRRHLHVSIFFLVQSWLSIEKDLRTLFSNIICFKISKSVMEKLFDEVIEHKKDYLLPIMKLVYDKPHQWMFINTDSGRIFKEWHELIFTEEA